MENEYAIDENLFFSTGDNRGVSLKYLVIEGEEGVGDVYSINILYSNLRKLYGEIKNSKFVYWKTKDESLTIRGENGHLELTFTTPDPPYKMLRNLTSDEIIKFKTILQRILEKDPSRAGLS